MSQRDAHVVVSIQGADQRNLFGVRRSSQWRPRPAPAAAWSSAGSRLPAMLLLYISRATMAARTTPPTIASFTLFTGGIVFRSLHVGFIDSPLPVIFPASPVQVQNPPGSAYNWFWPAEVRYPRRGHPSSAQALLELVVGDARVLFRLTDRLLGDVDLLFCLLDRQVILGHLQCDAVFRRAPIASRACASCAWACAV